ARAAGAHARSLGRTVGRRRDRWLREAIERLGAARPVGRRLAERQIDEIAERLADALVAVAVVGLELVGVLRDLALQPAILDDRPECGLRDACVFGGLEHVSDVAARALAALHV